MSIANAYAKKIVSQMMEKSFIHVDQPVKLTGQFALNAGIPGSEQGPYTPTFKFISSHLLVEVRALDPDIKIVKWVKYTDLFEVDSVSGGVADEL